MTNDSMEQIKQCLSCTKPKCNNSLVNTPSGKKKGRPSCPVEAYNSIRSYKFDSVHEAAAFVDRSIKSIRGAIQSGKLMCDYYWRYYK